MEIFKDIEGYEGLYQVSSGTTVKSVERDEIYYVNGKQRVRHLKEKTLRQVLDKDGYLKVCLSKNGVEKSKGVHVLMAQAFIPNPNNYEHVHHKNHDQTDNRIENLEWLSKEEHHALHNSDRVEAIRETKSKTVYQFEDDEIVNVWKSTREAARVLGFSYSNISACCRGELKTAYGYGWSYSPLYTKKRQDDLSLALI